MEPESTYYGLQIPPEALEGHETPVPRLYTDKQEMMNALKQFKGARFKVFTNEVEAVDFASVSMPAQRQKVKTDFQWYISE